MDTAVISHRVADFLKKHAPFHGVDDADHLALARGGRVRFYEPNEYILWQGEPHKYQVFVIQQGTVSLWSDPRRSPHGKRRRIHHRADLSPARASGVANGRGTLARVCEPFEVSAET